MKSPDSGIRYHLINDPSITALVDPKNIVCADLPQEDSFPAIVCTLDSKIPETVMNGPAGISRSVVGVHVYGRDSNDLSGLALVKRIGAAISASLNCFRGSWGTMNVHGVFLEEQSDMDPDAETFLFGISFQFVVWHS